MNSFHPHRSTWMRALCSLLLLLMASATLMAQLASKPAPKGHDHDELDGLLNMHDQEIHFVENKGQFGATVLYRADFPLGQAVATREGMLMSAYDPAAVEARQREGIAIEEEIGRGLPQRDLKWNKKGHGWLMHFRNASPAMRVESKEAHDDLTNYFLGTQEHQAMGVQNFQEVWYRDVYKGTDVRYYPAADGSLEYDIICKPGSDPALIALELKGIDRVRVTENGELVMSTSLGDMSYPAPVVYQRINGREKKVDAAYVIEGANVIRFKLGAYDPSQPLVIDPIAMRWATWVNTNSTGDNHGHAIWVDPADGAIYVVARVVGSTDNITLGAFDVTENGNLEIIVGKYLEPATVGGSGTRVWQTYIGGAGDDNPYAMEQGPDGNLYITGQTSSTNFPLIGGPAFSGTSIDQQAQSGIDVFVLKITQDGLSIKAAVVGGNGADDNFDVRTAPNGDVFVCGSTTSTNLLTLNAGSGASNTNNGGSDALVFRINQDLSSLVWMRNYGGSGADRASIMLHNPVSGDLFVGGNTASTNFPTVSPRQAARGGTTAGFLQRLTGAGATTWSSYYSSASGSDANLLCMSFNTDRTEFYFGGVTTGLNSANITSGSYDTSHNGSNDFYMGRMTIDQSLIAGTYVGGTLNEVNMMGLNTDLNNDVYVFGYTNSTNFPVSSSPNTPLQSTNQGNNDKVFLKLNSALSALNFSTYYGGAADDYDPVGERGIKFSNCRIYTIVTAQSNNIPLTQGALNTTKNSPTTRYEPGLVVWANPPDLLGNTISYQGVSICPGATPGDIIGSVPSYTLPTIVRNNTSSAYPAFPSAATYQWQISTDSLNWTNIGGATSQNLSGSSIGAISQTTYIRRIIGGDACILAGAADQVVTVRLMTVTGTATPALCNGGSTGSIVANADGQAPFTYAWSNGQSTQTAINLAAGAYSVTVTDFNGCSAIGNFNVGQPTAVGGSAQTTSATCSNNNGSATASGSGGSPGYSYLWSTGFAGPTLSGVPSGSYSVTITDSHGCDFILPVNIGGTSVPDASATGGTITCNTPNGIALNGGSSVQGATFSWSGPGGFTSQLEDPTVNATGTYTLTVTAPSGCTNTAQAQVEQDLATPGATATGGTITCASPSVTLGATGSGSFSWTGPNFTSNDQNPTVSVAGTYFLTVTGSNGCQSMDQAEVDTDLNVPQISITVDGTVTCNISPVTLTANGVGNGTILWTLPNGSTDDIAVIQTFIPGVYELTVTGTNGCMASTSAEVIDNTGTIDAEVSATLIGCNGEPALLSFTTDGQPFNIQWTGPNGFSAGTAEAYATEPGTYNLVLFTQANCTSEFTVEVSVDTDCATDCGPLIISCPVNITVQCADDFSPFSMGGFPEFRKEKKCPEINDVGWNDVILSNCPYVIRRTFWAEAEDGAYETCVQYITLIDEVAPIFLEVPADITMACDADLDAIVTPKVWAYDECSKKDLVSTHSVAVIPGNCAGSYTIAHTWTATDQCGNTGTATWNIEVIDNVAPVLQCKIEDLELNCQKIPAPVACTATDNCDADVDVTVEESKGEYDKDGKYVITRTYTATDDCGNTTTVIQLITVGCDPEPVIDNGNGNVFSTNLSAQVWPNPFRTNGTLIVTPKENGRASVDILDMNGRNVANLFTGTVSADQPLRLEFQPTNSEGGLYIYRIILNGQEVHGKLMHQP
ncbi:MAG: T9SS type A sorting domain-containing protein [Flavobacteriales bacterium]|nr:T9SS type A sorting domain-containing protein [Flavobacteriales bacterium]